LLVGKGCVFCAGTGEVLDPSPGNKNEWHGEEVGRGNEEI